MVVVEQHLEEAEGSLMGQILTPASSQQGPGGQQPSPGESENRKKKSDTADFSRA
jgi:hypothetical protein